MLFVTWADIITHAPVYALILIAWFGHKSMRTGISFYLLFAIAITSSVQIVGVYVVFASLILPALAALNARKKYMVAWSCGVLSVIAGISLAAAFDAPVGPVIVLSYVLTSVLVSTILSMRTVT
jgi:zinc/manganese transport system permease protein